MAVSKKHRKNKLKGGRGHNERVVKSSSGMGTSPANPDRDILSSPSEATERRADVPPHDNQSAVLPPVSGGEEPKQEAPRLTKNDVNEYMTALTEVIQDQRTNAWRRGYHTPRLSPLIDKLRTKLPTVQSVLLPPLLKHLLGDAMAPLLQEAEAVGDRYLPMVMADMEAGRMDRIINLMWLSAVNQARLKLDREPMFEKVVYYVRQEYKDDPMNPDAHTFFLPSRKEKQLAELWKRIDELVSFGLAVVRESIAFKVSGETHELVVITISDAP